MINIFDALHIKSTIQKQEPKTTLITETFADQ